MYEKKEMMCPLCYSRYGTGYPQRIPRYLDCRHTFCTECLLKLQDLQGSVIECPCCKLRTLLPPNGVDGLEKNMDLLQAVLRSEEEEQKLCNFCIHKVYPPKPATFFCPNCDVFMCGSCSDEIHSQLEFRCHSVCRASAAKDVTEDMELEKWRISSRPLSSSSFLSKRSSGLRPSSSNSSRPSSSLLNYAAIPECSVHKEMTKYYCRNCRCLCCESCYRFGNHKNHNCFQVHEAEERERKALVRLQTQVEQHGEKFIKARGEVQKAIEDVNKNTIAVKDMARRFYRELRTAIDQAEKLLMEDIEKRTGAKLKALNEQLSQMIEISSLATTACRNCDNALSMDYFEMLLMKKDVETEMMDALELLCEINPTAKGDLGCQFPNHENLLGSIRTCAKLVLPPGPPEKLICRITDDYKVHVKWDPPENNLFLYPVVGYILQSSSGPDNSFVDIYKGSETSLIIDKSAAELPVGKQVQFRACAINLIGVGPWGFPYGLKVPV